MTAFSGANLKRSAWQTTVMFTLAFWLSGSLILDWVIMPSMFATGMMTEPGFATAAYSIFWIFNRIELLCAALVLTGILVLNRTHIASYLAGRKVIFLSLLLLAIAIIDTYFLTPHMSALGIQLNLFDAVAETPAGMNQLHAGYWVLEAVKLIASGTLLGLCDRDR
ncbi:hypothetical protein H6F61_28830 [Cyanobacteria bacterium FACHB-472]|nr:hypothetical protein [Cyanobacteria bacterium FACHB-472]